MNSFRELKESTGQPAVYCISPDTAGILRGAEACFMASIRVKKDRDLVIVLTGPRVESIAQNFVGLADLHLKLTKKHGALLLYERKPTTGPYVMEMDMSKGHPLPKLTPIV